MWDLDPNWDSTYLVTACADFRARLFEITTGEYVAQMIHKGVVRSVKWGDGSQRFVTAADPFTSRDLGTISVYNFPSPEDLTEGMLCCMHQSGAYFPLLMSSVVFISSSEC